MPARINANPRARPATIPIGITVCRTGIASNLCSRPFLGRMNHSSATDAQNRIAPNAANIAGPLAQGQYYIQPSASGSDFSADFELSHPPNQLRSLRLETAILAAQRGNGALVFIRAQDPARSSMVPVTPSIRPALHSRRRGTCSHPPAPKPTSTNGANGRIGPAANTPPATLAYQYRNVDSDFWIVGNLVKHLRDVAEAIAGMSSRRTNWQHKLTGH